MPSITQPNPPRQCMAYATATDDLCRRDTYTTIEMGLADPADRSWQVLVEVPICDQHDDLLTAVSEEVNPTMGIAVADLDASTIALPTFRMSVFSVSAE